MDAGPSKPGNEDDDGTDDETAEGEDVDDEMGIEDDDADDDADHDDDAVDAVDDDDGGDDDDDDAVDDDDADDDDAADVDDGTDADDEPLDDGPPPEIVTEPPDVGNDCSTTFELTPTDVNSEETETFSVLPTQNPAWFGFTGAEVGVVNFDTDPGGELLAAGLPLTDEYAAIGVEMNSVPLAKVVQGGPASAPNATFLDTPQIFSFTRPVSAVGIINTSPDGDYVEIWSGPNRTGELYAQFQDQHPSEVRDYHIDRFVGMRVCGDARIGSLALQNTAKHLELDELLFEVAETSGPSTDFPAEEISATCGQSIDLAPNDVGSAEQATFSVLPSADPGLFGFDAAKTSRIGFDVTPAGMNIAGSTVLTNEYEQLGVQLASLTVRRNGAGGVASSPNATLGPTQVISFTTPVVAVGLINVSPEHDFVEVWSGPNRTGTLQMQFVDQRTEDVPNADVDRFVGVRLCDGVTIGSVVVQNYDAPVELDELIFELP